MGVTEKKITSKRQKKSPATHSGFVSLVTTVEFKRLLKLMLLCLVALFSAAETVTDLSIARNLATSCT